MTIQEIMKRYLEGKTNTEFANELGIQVSDASISYWKNGDRKPSKETLEAILTSQKATEDAKNWAVDCLVVISDNVSIEDLVEELRSRMKSRT
ncbi:MAG: helix-turn-helix domain-containing protein [Bellilinea sp.]